MEICFAINSEVHEVDSFHKLADKIIKEVEIECGLPPNSYYCWTMQNCIKVNANTEFINCLIKRKDVFIVD